MISMSKQLQDTRMNFLEEDSNLQLSNTKSKQSTTKLRAVQVRCSGSSIHMELELQEAHTVTSLTTLNLHQSVLKHNQATITSLRAWTSHQSNTVSQSLWATSKIQSLKETQMECKTSTKDSESTREAREKQMWAKLFSKVKPGPRVQIDSNRKPPQLSAKTSDSDMYFVEKC